MNMNEFLSECAKFQSDIIIGEGLKPSLKTLTKDEKKFRNEILKIEKSILNLFSLAEKIDPTIHGDDFIT